MEAKKDGQASALARSTRRHRPSEAFAEEGAGEGETDGQIRA
jgi:hypothetical protein